MRIVHMDFTGTFNVETKYQENMIPAINRQNGHEVTLITTCLIWKDGKLFEVPPEDTVMDNGVRLIRLPYKKILNRFVNEKVRAVNGLCALLESLAPEILMLHCMQTFAAYDVIAYVKAHPAVTLYCDSHSDFHNSARNFLSKHVLHPILYKPIVRKLLPYTGVVLCTTRDVMNFMHEMYDIPREQLEFFPLGGVPMADEAYLETRSRVRAALGLSDDELLIVHSGKMDRRKKTEELTRAFHAAPSAGLRLMIAGTMEPDVASAVMPLIEKDSRMQFTGWLTGDQLTEYLCAADLYAQPGTQSATMQDAAFCRCALMLYPYESYRYLCGGDDAFFVETQEDMEHVIRRIAEEPAQVKTMCARSYRMARERLDYRVLVERIEKRRTE